jgi:hypothetical protein
MKSEKLKLRYKTMEPPGGWTYRDKDTNVWIISRVNFADLIDKVREHRNSNELAIPDDLENQVETFICYRIPQDLVIGKIERKVTPHSLHAIQKFTQEFLQTIQNVKVISPDKAEERAKICLACPLNMSVVCMDCNGLDAWIRSWNGNRKTSVDDKLHACLADGIFVQASIHADAEFTQVKELPAKCWKRNGTDGTNATNEEQES